MQIAVTKTLKENRIFIVLILFMIVFRTSLADWNSVPTGSMKPTIIEGDRIWVNKLAYDLRIPFTKVSLKKFSDPKRGDIVIFNSFKADKRLVKRVIGIPGDTISMVNNVIFLNGEPLNYKMIKQDSNQIILEEKLSASPHRIKWHQAAQNRFSNIPLVTVPENAYLVLGDNRDNSADSRFIGFVPRHEILGRSRHVVMSLDYENYYLPRSERFLHKL